LDRILGIVPITAVELVRGRTRSSLEYEYSTRTRTRSSYSTK
jgi:hypothetical protein